MSGRKETGRFSKATLYSSYSNIQDGNKTSSSSKSIQQAEEALYTFVQELSADHLKQQSSAQTNRSLSAHQVQEKLQSRSIGLVSQRSRHGHVSRKRRPPNDRTSSRSRPVSSSFHNSNNNNNNNINNHQRNLQWKNDTRILQQQCDYLWKLNALWNDYIRNLLGMNSGGVVDVDTTIRDGPGRLTAVEWVGAMVLLESVPSHTTGWQGTVGIVLAETPRTWRVGFPNGQGVVGQCWTRTQDTRCRGTHDDQKHPPKTPNAPSYQELVIPKATTQLVALVRVTPDDPGSSWMRLALCGG